MSNGKTNKQSEVFYPPKELFKFHIQKKKLFKFFLNYKICILSLKLNY